MQLAEPLTSSANCPQPASTHSEEGRSGQSCDRAVPSCRVLNCSSPVPRAGGTGDFPDMRLPIVNKSPKTAKNVSAESVVCFGSGQKWSNIRGAGTLPLFVSIAFSKCTESEAFRPLSYRSSHPSRHLQPSITQGMEISFPTAPSLQLMADAVQVLFVEDEQGIRLTLPPLLASFGFKVTSAATVSEAVTLITQRKFDVLIADLNVGNPADGFTVVSAMRRIH